MLVDFVVGSPAVEVVLGVITDGVSVLIHEVEHVGVIFDVVADAKKGCFGVVFVEFIDYPRGYFVDGSIVEREVDVFALVEVVAPFKIAQKIAY